MILLFIFSVFIASCSQILLKKGSENQSSLFFNKYTISGYAVLVVSTFCTALAYKTMNLSFGVLLESLSYIFVPILSYKFLKEKVSKIRILGMVIIITGIIVFSL